MPGQDEKVDSFFYDHHLHLVYAGVLGLLGLAAGSFLNVVVYRLPIGMSLIDPPSSCPSCGHRIAPGDNIPLYGWLVLGGRCRHCRNAISWRYPAVELATGILWACVGWRLAGMDRGFYADIFSGLVELAFVSGLVVTFLVDWDHRIILDEVSLGGLVVAIVASSLIPAMQHAETREQFFSRYPELFLLFGHWPAWARGLCSSLVGAAVGLGFSLLFYAAGNWLFRQRIEEAKKEDPDIDSALGLGDVKLMAFYGAFLGWRAVLVIFLIASVFGSLYGIAAKLHSGDPGGQKGFAGFANRWQTGDSVLPFGPFLVIGAGAVFFFGDWLAKAAGGYAAG